MKSTQTKILIIALLFTIVQCKENEVESRKLPRLMKFSGSAEGVIESITIRCSCDLQLELTRFKMKDEKTQLYSGILGGEITRMRIDELGAGFSLSPFLYGNASVILKSNDSVYVSWPVNLNSDSNTFYNEIALFKGVLNPDKTITGSWKCAPFNISEGSYIDLNGIVAGEWKLEGIE